MPGPRVLVTPGVFPLAAALPLLAMGSLLIAAKMEEEEINVPTVSSLLDAAESNASMQELNVMELLILKIWGWNGEPPPPPLLLLLLLSHPTGLEGK